jgi:HEAT repeat protein
MIATLSLVMLLSGGAPSVDLVQDLATCTSLRANRCLFAATRLRNKGCQVTRKVSKKLSTMSTPGQVMALSVLDACDSRKGGKALTRVIKNTKLSDAIRALAVEALARRPHRGVTHALLWAIQAKRSILRAAAARALGNRKLGKEVKRVIGALVDAARDADPSVRVESLIGLRLAKYPQAGPVFTRALADTETRVKKAAAQGLQGVTFSGAVIPLIKTLQSPNGLLREMAVKALKHQTGMSYPEDYALWMEWYESQ